MIKRIIKTLLLSVSMSFPLYSQTSLGIDLGMEQHVAGGGPVLGLTFYKPSYRGGVSLNTQINAFTPYELGPYDGYRFADDFKQYFGGGIHFGYVFKSRSGQKIKPLLEYRSNYFYTRYGKNEKQMDMNGEFYRAFFYSVGSGFSTHQTVAAGITADLGKNFFLDATLGTGVYVFQIAPYYSTVKYEEFSSSLPRYTEVRPDLNVRVSVNYRFRIGK